MSKGTFGKNFIKELPEGENAAVDESLLSLQFRCRKGSEWEKYFRPWLSFMRGEMDLDDLSNVYDGIFQEAFRKPDFDDTGLDGCKAGESIRK